MIVKGQIDFFSVWLVLQRSQPEHRYMIEETTLEYWFTCLLDLMRRFQLNNEATNLIKKCPVPAINQINQQSTTYLSNCTKCNKALSRPKGAWWCERCKRTPNLCDICCEIVIYFDFQPTHERLFQTLLTNKMSFQHSLSPLLS